MQGLGLLGIYVAVALGGQVLGYGMTSLIERAAPSAGLPVFLAIFLGMLVLAWPIAVALMNWLFPEPTKAPAISPLIEAPIRLTQSSAPPGR